MDRGIDQSPLIEAIRAQKNLSQVYCISETGEKIAQELDTDAMTYAHVDEFFEEIEKSGFSGKTILYSPGAASYNQYINMVDRGRKFGENIPR